MKASRYAIAVLPFFIAVAVWAFWIEPASLSNENHDLAVPGWPEACGGTRVAVLADLHVGSPYNGLDKLEQIVRLTQAAAPDLILLAGDYLIHGVVGGTHVPPQAVAHGLSELSAPMGVFAVLGNHDWRHGASEVQRALETVGIPVLEDESIRVGAGACRFWLTGISDFWRGPHDVEAALAAVPREAPVLVLTHNPDVFPEIPSSVSLTVAGHTHGGQVYLPLLGRLVVPSRYGQRYAIGHIVEDGRHLFVSSGLGTSIIPVRFLVPPEVSVLDIRGRVPPAQKPGF